MRVLTTPFTAVLLLFFIISPPPTSTTAEMESPTIQSDNLAPSPYVHSSFNKTCDLFSFLDRKCDPQLSSVYFAFSIVYLSFLVHWILVCFKVKPTFRRIHLLMAGLIQVKALNLIYAAVNATGGNRSGLFFYISKFISVVRLSIVIQLIASGWYFMEPIMQNADRIVLLLLILLQVLTNVVRIMIGDANNSVLDWMNLNDMLGLIDLIACGVVMFPMICSMVYTHADGMRDKFFEKLTEFRYFCTIVAFYLLFLGVIVGNDRKTGHIGLNAIDAHKYLIESNMVIEINSLTFYMIICTNFRKQFAFLVDHHE